MRRAVGLALALLGGLSYSETASSKWERPEGSCRFRPGYDSTCGTPDLCGELRLRCDEQGNLTCTTVETAEDGTPCGDACNEGATCRAGICTGGQAPVCRDEDPCTIDTCEPAAGCAFPPRRTAACCNLGVEPLGHADAFARGPVEDVLVEGEIAYVARGRLGVSTYDVSDPTRVRELGHLDTTGAARRLFKQGHLLFSGDARSGFDDTAGLRIIDVRHPTDPRLLARAEPQPDIRGLHVHDGVVWVGGYEREIRALDVSDPSHPRERLRFASDLHTLTGEGPRLYAIGAELTAYDVTHPEGPAALARVDTWDYFHGLVAWGDRVYASSTGRLAVFEIGDASAVELHVEASDAGRASVATAEHLFVAGGRGFHVFARTDPPEPLGDLSGSGGEALAVEGSRAYVGVRGHPEWATSSSWPRPGGLQILDLSDLRAPRQITRVWAPGASRRVRVRDGLAYVADLDGGLRVFDVTEPRRPRETSRVELGNLAFEVGLTRDAVVIATAARDASYLGLYSSGPQPEYIDGVNFSAEASAMHATGDRVYVVTENDRRPELHGFRIDGRRLLEAGVLELGDGHRSGGMTSKGNLLYVMNGELVVVDTTNLDDPKVVSVAAPPRYTVDLAVQDDFLYGVGASGLVVWSLQDPRRPRVVAEVPLEHPGFDPAVVDGYLLIPSGEAGVVVLDVADPRRPAFVDRIPVTDYAWGVDVVGADTVVVADASGLLTTYALTCR